MMDQSSQSTQDTSPDILFCPFCGAKNIKRVQYIPRCVDCRAVFLVNFLRYARKSPRTNKI